MAEPPEPTPAPEPAPAQLEPPGDGDEGIFIIPGLADDGSPHVMIQWADQIAEFAIDDARMIGMNLIEAAEVAEVESQLHAWLLRDATDKDNAAAGAKRILQSFRAFRAEQAAAVT